MKLYQQFLGMFSRRTYAYLHGEAQGLNFGYSLLLSALIAVATTIFMSLMIAKLFAPLKPNSASFVTDAAEQIIRQLPELTYEGGEHKSKVNEATAIYLRDDRTTPPIFGQFLTIDTRENGDMKSAQTPILVTTREIVFKNTYSNETSNPLKLSLVADFLNIPNGATSEIISEKIRESVKRIHDTRSLWLPIVAVGVWLASTLLYFLLRVILLCFIAGIIMLVGAIRKTPLGFKPVMRVAAVAYTPVALLDLAFGVVLGHGLSQIVVLIAGLFASFLALRSADAFHPRA